MVIERDTLAKLDPYEQSIAENYMQHNLRLAGENNNPLMIGQLRLLPGFKVEDLTGREWTVSIMGVRGHVDVKRPNIDHNKPGEREFIHILWPPSKLVRVPKEKI